MLRKYVAMYGIIEIYGELELSDQFLHLIKSERNI